MSQEQTRVPQLPDDGPPEIKAAVHIRRRELEAERAKEYERIDEEMWG